MNHSSDRTSKAMVPAQVREESINCRAIVC